MAQPLTSKPSRMPSPSVSLVVGVGAEQGLDVVGEAVSIAIGQVEGRLAQRVVGVGADEALVAVDDRIAVAVHQLGVRRPGAAAYVLSRYAQRWVRAGVQHVVVVDVRVAGVAEDVGVGHALVYAGMGSD